jgi:HAD superfamily hydrolase (TIGR01509 family)
MTGPKAILFDVDGTLVDSVDLHARAWVEALGKYGFEVRHEAVRAQIGKGGDELLPLFVPQAELERIGEELSSFRDALYRRAYRGDAKPFPRVRDLFARLRADGRSLALASSGKAEDVEYYEALLGIERLLDAGATTSDDAERSKPHPDIFQAALARTGARPEEAVAVGDSPWDAISAGRAGIRTVGLLCGGFPEPDLRAAGCIEVYRDPAELLARYDVSPLAR